MQRDKRGSSLTRSPSLGAIAATRFLGQTRPSSSSTSTYYIATHAITVINVRVKRYLDRIMVTSPAITFACYSHKRAVGSDNFLFAKNHHKIQHLSLIDRGFLWKFQSAKLHITIVMWKNMWNIVSAALFVISREWSNFLFSNTWVSSLIVKLATF